MVEQIVLQIVVPSDGADTLVGLLLADPELSAEFSDLTVKTAELR